MASHNNLHALLYQTASAEYLVMCLQAYQLARHALQTRLATGTFRQPAVILDLDEPVRNGLEEPQTPFAFDNGTKTATPKGPKFSDRLGVWDRDRGVSPRS